MSVINSQPLIGASGNQGAAYNIERSLRLRNSASAYLSRTPASASSLTTFTFSTWVKRGRLDIDGYLFSAVRAGPATDAIRFNSDGSFGVFYEGSGTVYVKTSSLYRDPSAWYHVVVQIDSTQATASNRIRIYVNGSLVTALGITNYPAQNATFPAWNRTVLHTIGNDAQIALHADQYLAETHFIDGQALTPSSFGETDTITGVWKPKRYTGTYGTNGFYLKFNNLTSTSTLGNDSSGNSNTWTVNNVSLTAGTTYDSMTDVPTLTSATAANYAVLNPLSTTSGTYSNANLRYVAPSSYRRSNATLAISTGKWYWEVTLGNAPESPRSSTSAYNAFGFGLSTAFASTTAMTVTTDVLSLSDNGYYKNFSGSFTDGGTGFASGDVLSVAVDLDANTYTFYRNNSSLVTGTIGGTSGRELVPIILSYNSSFGVMDCNFGQRPFAYTPPSGFVALNTFNLPTSTIVAGNTVMDATTYSGNSSTQTITNAGGFKPDLVWYKGRSTAFNHRLFDSVRGVSKDLSSNLTDVEGTISGVTAFNSNGFTLGSEIGGNRTGDTYVAWQWQAGQGSTSSNTAGTQTSTVSVNASAGFSIATFTCTGVNVNGTVGHGLGVAPKLIITKSRGSGSNWVVYHSSVSTDVNQFLRLNDTSATVTLSNVWGDALPTSTVFGIRGDVTLAASATAVAYCWAEIAGFSKFGSYTGNGSSDGPFIFTGFRPKFVLYKRSDGGTESWRMLDTSRDQFNLATNRLAPNDSAAEGTSTGFNNLDFLSNGFKVRSSSGDQNASSATYVYMAFAENPTKFALAR